MRTLLAWACFKTALGFAAIGVRLDPPSPVIAQDGVIVLDVDTMAAAIQAHQEHVALIAQSN